jgi:hypothetical protein
LSCAAAAKVIQSPLHPLPLFARPLDFVPAGGGEFGHQLFVAVILPA